MTQVGCTLSQGAKMQSIVKLDPNGLAGQPLTSSNYCKPENVEEGIVPTELAQTFLNSEDGRFSIGVWECEPCTEVMNDYPADEYCLVLQGLLEITANGRTQVFEPGDSFMIRKGTNMVWAMRTPFKKYFAIYHA
jgi:uncharacterized protein